METPAPASPAPESEASPAVASLERELRSQGFLVRTLMVVVTLLLLTTTLALFHQIRWLVAQANQLNFTVQELARGVGDYETNVAPQMNRLIEDLRRFAQSNPDFARVLARYHITNAPPGRTNPPTQPPGR
jgi:hypothetical protein